MLQTGLFIVLSVSDPIILCLSFSLFLFSLSLSFYLSLSLYLTHYRYQVAARLIKPGNTNAMVTAAVKKVRHLYYIDRPTIIS